MSRYKKLIEQVDEAHDWEYGQAYGHGGTAYSCTDTCRICGLNRKYFSDGQNGVRACYTFETMDGEDVVLRDAAELEC